MKDRRDAVGLGLISAGSLTFEIALTRLFAIQQFHHFAFVVVSLAVMGIAASGLVLSVRRRHPPRPTLALGFSLTVILTYVVVNVLPFDSFSIAWDRKQIGILLLYFLAAGAPFLFTGWVVGASLADAGAEAHLPYAANLVGSAAGCLVALVSLDFVGSVGTTAFAASLGILAAIVFQRRRKARYAFAILLLPLLALSVVRPAWMSLRISPYKPLSVTLLFPDAERTLTVHSASARVDVVETGSIRVWPGLSLNAVLPLPEQSALFLDGDGPLPLTALDPDDELAQSLAAHLPTALAYELRPGADALLLEPGAGSPILSALAAGADRVTAPFEESAVRRVVEGPYAAFQKRLLQDPRVIAPDRSGRGTLASTGASFDVVQFALSDPYRPVTSGAFSLTENYILTVEALTEGYSRLNDEGILTLTRWLGTPPSEAARTWSMLLEVMRRAGVGDLEQRLIAYRGMRTATLLASRQPFSSDELSHVRAFLERNAFDPIHLPDLDPKELNRFNVLPEDVYHELFKELLQQPRETIASYDFRLEPPTDDRPFFFHFFRWRQTRDILARFGMTWQPFGGSGYLVLLALLGLMLALGLPFAVTPLILYRRRDRLALPGPWSMVYFAGLGAGYLLVEIPLIQRMTLLLDRPTFALAAVLFTVLFCSGLGSLASTHIPLRTTLLGLLVLLLAAVFLLSPIVEFALAWPLLARLLIAFLALAPLGFLMGIPFASGLRRLERSRAGWIPWAWAVNGAVSGVSGVGAAMIALDLGIRSVLAAGFLAYLIALFAAERMKADA
jgi:hypothetical protein